MAPRTSKLKFFSLLISSMAFIQMAMAGDADILTDFIPTPNGTVDGTSSHTLTFGGGPPAAFKVIKATMAEFPALNGHSVSYAVIQFSASTTNPPHTHPRSAEILFLAYGTLEVDFVDTKNNLFNQTLQAGDLFVFPKGLAHFQYNVDPQKPTLAISAFGSANAGTVSIPTTLFATGIDDNVLAISFRTYVATIQKLKAGLAVKS